MAGKSHIICKDTIIADMTVMRHMRTGHEQIAISNLRCPSPVNSPRISRHVFTKDIILTDL